MYNEMSVTLISVSHDTVVSNKHEERTRHYYVIFPTPSCKPVKSLLTNTWRQDGSYPPNLPKLPHSFSYPKKMVPYALARTTDILIPTPSGMRTLCHLSLNSLMTWRMPPSSQSLTSDGAITTSAFMRKTNGKLPSSPPWDFSNQQWCSLGFAMHHLHSKPLWTTSSPTW